MNAPFLIEAAERPAPGTLIIDTRKPDAYARGHIPGAFNLSTYDCFVKSTQPADLAEFRAQVATLYGAIGATRERSVVVYEDDTGMRAARELWIFEYLGHTNVRMLHGGLKAWVAEGGEVTTEVPTFVRSRFDPDPVEAIVIGADEVHAASASGAITALDVRDANEYAGRDNTVCCARRGHIPKAAWLEWTEFLDAATGKFKSAQAIHTLLAARGIDPRATLVPYCHRGARSANTYYALRYAGIASVRNYIGSFHEWSARADLPIETGEV
jgi:thiosulfate/3-mercaptopyruvate sulfurtransferase